MAKRILIDATHPEQTRVAVVGGQKLDDFDFESISRKQLKGNIYLAKVIRIEPSLQAAFVEYGGNRHGFLAFSEIHHDYYRIPVADREALQQALREEQQAEHAAENSSDAATESGLPHEHAYSDFKASPPNDGFAAAFRQNFSEEEAPSFDASSFSEAGFGEGDKNHEAGGLYAAPRSNPLAATSGSSSEPILSTLGFLGDEHSSPTRHNPILNPFASAEGFGGDSHHPYGLPGETPEAAGLVAGAFATDGGGADDESSMDLPAGDGIAEISGDISQEMLAELPVEMLGGDEVEGQLEGQREQQRRRFPRRYKIQEVIKRGQIMLIQVVKEERGNKGAALTTYLSLAGRYCVLMPNTDKGGGISRKITSIQDRRRMKEILDELETPDGMAVILRTAGMERSKIEVKRDLEYLMRLWESIRDLTMQSIAPSLIYEEADLIKRAIRDLYSPEIESILVEGEAGYHKARDFMRMLMPSHTRRVHFYRGQIVPLFHRYQMEGQIQALHSPVVQLRSGGYIVINQTEALVAIDVNSGRSTRERNIEETAYRTNLEAADEVARQLRLRDLAGLVVIDFIDMEDNRNNASVERRLKEAMRHDRARLQIGRISHFGLLELSRQRLRPSLLELDFEKCPHCQGTGHIRLIESAALLALHAVEEEGIRQVAAAITITLPPAVALYILNHKRAALADMETRYGFSISIKTSDAIIGAEFPVERLRLKSRAEQIPIHSINEQQIFAQNDRGGVERGNHGGAGNDGLPEEAGDGVAGDADSPFSHGQGDSMAMQADDQDNGGGAPNPNQGLGQNGGRRRGRRGGRRRGSQGVGQIVGQNAEPGSFSPQDSVQDIRQGNALGEAMPQGSLEISFESSGFEQGLSPDHATPLPFGAEGALPAAAPARADGRRAPRSRTPRPEKTGDRTGRNAEHRPENPRENPRENRRERGGERGGSGRLRDERQGNALQAPLAYAPTATPEDYAAAAGVPAIGGSAISVGVAPIAPPAYTPPPYIPASVFDLDTTPKEAVPLNTGTETLLHDQNIQQDSPEKRKTGWWQRLTGVS